MARDSFIFYRSFYEATQYLKSDQKAELFDAICAYALDHKEIEMSGVCKAMFGLIKPQLDANYKRWQNGSKPKAKHKQKVSKVKANVNDNDCYIYFNHLSINKSNYNKLVKEYNKERVNNILEQIENFKGNTKYKSLYLTAKNWLKRENNGTKKERVSDFDPERAFGISL